MDENVWHIVSLGMRGELSDCEELCAMEIPPVRRNIPLKWHETIRLRPSALASRHSDKAFLRFHFTRLSALLRGGSFVSPRGKTVSTSAQSARQSESDFFQGGKKLFFRRRTRSGAKPETKSSLNHSRLKIATARCDCFRTNRWRAKRQ
jgi:hypothetical protein